MKTMDRSFCVSCFLGVESPVLKEEIGYTLRHGKYIILLRKQVSVPQYLFQQTTLEERKSTS